MLSRPDSPGDDRIIEISTPSPARNPLVLPGYGTVTLEVSRATAESSRVTTRGMALSSFYADSTKQ